MFASNTSQVSADQLFIEDVFSTYLYTGNGSSQTITNGIDLAGKGGLVWCKGRSIANSHSLFDTARGATKRIFSDTTDAESTNATTLTAFNSDGFSLGSNATANASGSTYTSWTFRKAPKFFDVVTYTGNGTSQTISHGLGSVPGYIIVKRTDSTSNWFCYHRALGNAVSINLNQTSGSVTNTSIWNSTDPTATSFSVGASSSSNVSGATYVAYLFAHDTATDGVIQCGSFTTDGSGNATVNLGWEPQWVMLKASSTTSSWVMFDNMRGMPVGAGGSELEANTSGAESTGALYSPKVTATGFSTAWGIANSTAIYIAIRRGPMRTPTSGTSVFSPTLGFAGVPGFQTSWPVDASIVGYRPGYVGYPNIGSRLTGTGVLATPSTVAEATNSLYKWDYMNGWLSSNLTSDYIGWNFRRAPGFFDEVCYTGTGVARTVNHNLGVVPELMIVKRRDSTGFWAVYTAATGAANVLELQSTAASTSGSAWNSTSPTASVFTVGNTVATGASGGTYVAYLFASCPGVSKVFNYTGNGSSQTINCGFAAGARFVLIKRTDSTGGWYVWDTARGIVSANDPRLSLNSTSAEVTTDDSVDPNSSGFIVNQNSSTNINVNGATYIYLAIA